MGRNGTHRHSRALEKSPGENSSGLHDQLVSGAKIKIEAGKVGDKGSKWGRERLAPIEDDFLGFKIRHRNLFADYRGRQVKDSAPLTHILLALLSKVGGGCVSWIPPPGKSDRIFKNVGEWNFRMQIAQLYSTGLSSPRLQSMRSTRH